ncbi:hypothetical protein QIS99_25380 [Streptomyces sp. B-S-A8]|uniref:Transposase n=1 Tax=Streptomyces solicavernae TaxID=3043614 RepID=A0ABT6RYK0_9ACTN|nr:hypothetical protein [Streptomyces sp. B-S-A8]MDI3389500.1 hypothetical protein [Streptomyces sp. B-S-A8]
MRLLARIPVQRDIGRMARYEFRTPQPQPRPDHMPTDSARPDHTPPGKPQRHDDPGERQA